MASWAHLCGSGAEGASGAARVDWVRWSYEKSCWRGRRRVVILFIVIVVITAAFCCRCLGAELCVNPVRWAKASVPRDKL